MKHTEQCFSLGFERFVKPSLPRMKLIGTERWSFDRGYERFDIDAARIVFARKRMASTSIQKIEKLVLI
ncbi:hypothetical protein G6321_00020510 [Bradyrhizobium barranii subsp. barranii]|uniref:Uncharacterized protein n=1 Tax=Bradyrhizobium barranii subsp. barranii TaxID=2823807 RepID=A0A7Z0QJU4_9BRAD|nr:hypothetical protein [Bradyrhizobium barranii]UGX97378.1 hypothetical protein G6321_00020510 [Bradyrhizobium barranii subsp. barranii]